MALEWLINLHCVRSWNAKFDERDIAGFEAVGSQGGSVGQSLASGTASAAHSLAAPAQSPRPAQEAAETPRDSGFNQPTQTLVQEVAAMMQQECLERAEKARGALVKTWQEKAKKEGKGRDLRGTISSDCMDSVEDLMKEGELDLRM